jgi:hypothetical protein
MGKVTLAGMGVLLDGVVGLKVAWPQSVPEAATKLGDGLAGGEHLPAGCANGLLGLGQVAVVHEIQRLAGGLS